MSDQGAGSSPPQKSQKSQTPYSSRGAAGGMGAKCGRVALGNGVYDDSNECNWVNNGKGDWNIEFDNTGEDLKGALANPACPY